MNGNRINHLNELDASALTFENLRWQYGVFHTLSTGSGRNKKYSYWNGVQTKLGEIEETLWYQLAEMLIQQSSEQELLSCLIQWGSEHNYINAPASEIRKNALDLHISRIFDNPKWVGFIPFNRRYRPEVLETAHLVTVVTDCCKQPGEVTQEQIDAAYQGEIACPHCGVHSSFSAVGQEDTQNLQAEMEMI